MICRTDEDKFSSATYIMKKSTMESFGSSPSTKVSRSNCRTVILATDGSGGNTATILEHGKKESREGSENKLNYHFTIEQIPPYAL